MTQSLDYLSLIWKSSQQVILKTAPTGYIYSINGVLVINNATASNILVMSAKQQEESLTLVVGEGSFLAFRTTIDGAHLSVDFDPPLRTKHLTFGPELAVDISTRAYVYYTLEKATTPELIWEFIKRGKNP